MNAATLRLSLLALLMTGFSFFRAAAPADGASNRS
jgi:hypothetical protein